MSNYTQLQAVLNEIFELDKADLDFGIYRIMNQKRRQVSEFIDTQLPKSIAEALADTQTTDKTQLENELDTLKKNLAGTGIAAEETPKYKTLTEQLNSISNSESLENEVFSHLANFFKRYYKDGDFISMRRYKKDVYAIPYEGEEVKLHWANHDQYYIKSSENFKNYSFTLSANQKVSFKLKEVSTEQNNNKAQADTERRFALYSAQPVEILEGELVINFTYEPYTKGVKQETLLTDAIKELTNHIPAHYIGIFELKPTEKNKTRTLLEKHLSDYVSKNSFDYFIHKDLGGFLNRELDFYIKNEVLYLDDINTKETQFFVAQLSKVKAIKVVAQKIIDFLAQIENFQKKLWLKKKFVVSTNYCITLDRIPESYFPEIAANQAQVQEWVSLFSINEIKPTPATTISPESQGFTTPLTATFLKENPYLVLDTKFFNEAFTDKLLAEFDDLDQQTDGLLINSENFQALNLMQEKYREKVDAVHIDPPYNTQTSGFLYKNSYQHSSWLSLMQDRIVISTSMLSENANSTCHIDENEYERLKLIFESQDLVSSGTLIWDKRNPMLGRKGLATQHEYIIWLSKIEDPVYSKSDAINTIHEKLKTLIQKYGIVNNDCRIEYSKWLLSNKELTGGEKAYKYVEDKGEIFRLVAMGAPEKRTNPKFFIPLVHPVTGKECPIPSNGWSRTPETLKELIQDGLIVFGKDEKTQPQKKVYLKEDATKQLTTVYSDGKSGKVFLEPLGLEFPYSHPLSLYEHILSCNLSNSTILDYFAGSGTTGHATIKLNREDGGKRKYILVEMGTYFNTVTKPRIQKVIYSDNWKGGKPQDKVGISQMFKYQVLESYEDTLNNLYLTPKVADGEIDFSSTAQEQYLLHYMLEIESREHLFNLAMFRNPFSYQLNITENNELKPTTIDLVETFNYLIGMYVSRVQRIGAIKVIEGATREGVKTLIIWRDLDTSTQAELDRIIRVFYDGTKTSDFQQIYINGDNHLENPRTDGGELKVKLIEETFFKKMFNEQEL